MSTSMKHNMNVGGAIRAIVATLALATAVGGMSTAIARADGYDRGHEDRGRHAQRGHQQWHGERESRGYVYERPRAYSYAPPPVYYYEPPPPPPVIDFVFPLHLR